MIEIESKRYSEVILKVIEGSYDLHIHTSPSHFNRDLNDIELLKESEKYNMAGVLVKSHYEGTYGRAALINEYFKSETKVYGGLALNWPVGGLNPYAVESALNLGAKIIWMPTRDSVNSLKYGNMVGDFFERDGIPILGKNNKLVKEVYEILEIIKKYNAYIATGHLSPKESIVLCEEARKMGVNTILTHPDFERTVVPLETQIMLANKGVLIEKCWLNIAEKNISEENMVKSIKAIGAENIYLTTDRGQYGEERPIKAMFKYIHVLLDGGISEDELNLMLKINPKKIISN